MAGRSTYGSDRLRTVALVGHRGGGKTSLAEAMLAAAGAVRVAGAVEEGTALLDFDPDERRRRGTLYNGFAWIPWQDSLVQLIDTPGGSAAAYERSLAIAAADAVVVVVDAGEALPVGAEAALVEALGAGVPALVFVNKLDRPHAQDALLDALRATVDGPRVVALQAVLDEALSGGPELGELLAGCAAPWMQAPFEQLAEAVALTDDALLEHYLEHFELPLPSLRTGLCAAVGSGRLVPVLYGSARPSGAQGDPSPRGVERLLDLLVELVPPAAARQGPLATEYDGTPVRVGPDAGPLLAQLVSTAVDAEGAPYHVLRVWRGEAKPNQVWVNGATGASGRVRKLYKLRGPRRATAEWVGPGALLATWDPLPGRPGATFCMGERLVIAPPERPPSMMAYALSPRTDRDGQRLQEALVALLATDAALDVHTEDTTGQLLLRGHSEEHLQLAVERLARRGVEVVAALPPIPYRETPVSSVHGVCGVHRREDHDGLPIEFGACLVDVEPSAPEVGFRFEDAFPDREELPSRYRPAIDEGVRLALRRGPTAGYPVLGASVRLTGGEYDILQSTEDHFRLAGEIAARSALERAGTRLLEPWWQVDVYARGGDLGEVISEISGRRGRIVGMEVLGAETRLLAQMPYRELRTFGPRLQATTSGRGRFYGDFLQYEVAPAHVAGEAIAASPFRRAG